MQIKSYYLLIAMIFVILSCIFNIYGLLQPALILYCLAIGLFLMLVFDNEDEE